MKKLFLLLVFIPSVFIGQNESAESSTVDLSIGRSMTINYKTENIGNPYLYDTWKEGYVIVNDSVVSPQKKMQVDLQKGELILGLEEGRGTIIDDESVTGFAINKKNNSTRHYFVRLIDSQFENSQSDAQFFEIISKNGKTNNLVKEVQKYLFDPNKSRGYQTQNSLPMEYKEKTYYFVKNNKGVYIKTKLSKKAVLKILDDKSKEIKSYLSDNKVSFSKEYDVAKLLDYYHSL